MPFQQDTNLPALPACGARAGLHLSFVMPSGPLGVGVVVDEVELFA